MVGSLKTKVIACVYVRVCVRVCVYCVFFVYLFLFTFNVLCVVFVCLTHRNCVTDPGVGCELHWSPWGLDPVLGC